MLQPTQGTGKGIALYCIPCTLLEPTITDALNCLQVLLVKHVLPLLLHHADIAQKER